MSSVAPSPWPGVPVARSSEPQVAPERSPRDWIVAALPSGDALTDAEWSRHHRVVSRVLVLLAVLVPLYGLAAGYGVLHVAAHAAPLLGLTVLAASTRLGRAARGGAAALGLMTASALVVHASNGATEAHFMFFALLPLAAVYAAWPPFLLAVGFVAVHHFVLGSIAPAVVFDHEGSALGLAGIHAAFVLAESLACLVAWRLFEDRREVVERLVIERTAELSARRDELARLAAVVESTDDSVVSMTPDGRIETWNPGAERLYGYTAAEVVGRHVTMLVAPERRDSVAATLERLPAAGAHVETQHVRAGGASFDAQVALSAIRDESGAVRGVVAICRDVSERKRNEAEARRTAGELEAQAQELSRLALHDPLTGLANRALMHDRLEHALRARDPQPTGVLLLDLDEFKAVNDVSGHLVGDQVLVEVARRVQTCVRPADTVARIGGDEFVVLVEGIAGDADAQAVADRILVALRAPIDVADERFTVAASIGVTVAHRADGRGPIELLRDADIAMYAAKGSGKGRQERFEPSMRDRVVEQTELARDLRRAVDHQQLRLLYQPQVELSSGRMTGVEALVRWEHPERGLLTPDRFVPAAEHNGTIVAIDDWVLREACRQMRAWDDAGLEPLDVAVNVSACRLVTGDLAGAIADATRQEGVHPGRLEIEITETVAVAHEDAAVETIKEVRALGVRVAIDDFGMGHSALSRLRTFPVDRLKIDRSFIAPLSEGTEHGSIAEAMIAIGHSLGLEVVAEGVETEEHLRALRSLGCGSSQGYLFSRPTGARDIEGLLRSGRPLAPPAESAPEGDRRPVDRTDPPDRLTRNVLAELQRLTGLESTYLTRVDWDAALQHITHVRNTGSLDIPEGESVDWSDSVCRRALEQGVSYTDDVASTFPDSDAASALGLQTYVSVPLRGEAGEVQGVLCGASSQRVRLGPETIRVMEGFARILGQQSRSPQSAVGR